MTAQVPPPIPSPNPIDRLYQLMLNDRLLAALVALLAVAVFAGMFLPQAPAGLADPDATSRWLAETSASYGGLGPLLQSANLFDLWHSAWFRGLVAALAFVLLLRLGQSIADTTRRLRNPDPAQAVAQAKRWPLHAALELAGDSASTMAELSEDLRSEGWRAVSAETSLGTAIVAERSPWGLAAVPFFYAGVLLALAGLWLGQLVGWRESGVALLPGQPVALSHDKQLSLSLAADGDETVAVHANGAIMAHGAFSPAGRVRLAGLSIRRTGQGRALAVSASDPSGAALQPQSSDQQGRAQAALDLVFDQPRAEQVFFVPARELVVSVVAFPSLPERGFSSPTFLVQAFKTGQREPVLNRFVEQDAELTIAGDRFLLSSGPLVTVEVSQNRAGPLLAAGIALAMASIAVALWRPAGRLAVTAKDLHEGPARDASRASARTVSVDVSVHPSPIWRQAGRWLLAWTSTYATHEQD